MITKTFEGIFREDGDDPYCIGVHSDIWTKKTEKWANPYNSVNGRFVIQDIERDHSEIIEFLDSLKDQLNGKKVQITITIKEME